jgi:TonB family protein
MNAAATGRVAITVIMLVSPLAAQSTLADATAHTTTAVALRARPDSSARAVAGLSAETAVHIIGCENDWCQVGVQRRLGYLPRHSLALDAELTVAPAEAPSVDTVLVFINEDQKADRVFVEALVEERPEVLSTPPVMYPPAMRRAGLHGRVLVQAIIDTLGRAEPASIRIKQSPDAGFDQSARDFMLHALFRPARLHRRAVRVLVNVPIDYRIRVQAEKEPP